MVKALHFIFLFLFLVLTGCKKNEFMLEFELDQSVKDNYNVTYYASDSRGGLTVQAVASVRDGKCELKGITKLPTMVYVTARRSEYPLVFMASRGENIKISGEGSDPLGWKVEGNELNRELTEWRLQNDSILALNNADSVDMAVKRYVELNPENPVSTVLMLTYFHRSPDEREYTGLMASLKAEAKDHKWLELLARGDQFQHSYSFPARLESVIMKSNKGATDTLLLNRRDPAMMFFWQTGYSDKKTLIDSLKSIEKDYADSVVIVADLCLDVDSVSWRNAIRRDSLEKVKRFWVPLGLTDGKIMKLKVNSLPFYIVFDKEGNQVYRGQQLSEAMEIYRNLQEESGNKIIKKQK